MTARHGKDNSGSLTREKFLLPETCIVARLRLEGEPDERIVERAAEENLFQFPTTKMAKDIARVCLRRLDSLGSEPLTTLLAHGTPDQRRQANVYVMMRHYDLVRLLMVEEIGNRFQTLDYTFDALDMNVFFTRYLQSNESARSWAESTQKRIKTELFRILHEGGMLDDANGSTLVPPFLDYDVECGIRANGDAAWLVAFDCAEV